MRYFLGVDVGSSKTHALIADESGNCIGFGRAWGGNHQNVGYDGLARALEKSCAEAIHQARLDPAQLCGAGFGVGGYDFISDRAGHLEAIAALGLSCPVEVINDGVLGLLAGARDGIGVNVTAGSSVNCRGRGRDGREGRIVGNGSDFGEFGGGYEIVQRGLHMVNYAWIQRIPATQLTQIYLQASRARDEMELMEGLSSGRYTLSPRLAIEVFQAARSGDSAANEVVRWAGEELGWLAVAVARQVNLEDDEVEVIQSGSLFKAGEIIHQPMQAVIHAHCGRAKLIRLEGAPVVGAVILGMLQVDFDGYAVRSRLIETAKPLIAIDNRA